MDPRYRGEAAVQPAWLRVVLDRSSQQEEDMPTIALRPSRLVGEPHRLAKWLVAAILVAVVATTLAVSLIGSGDERADPSAGATQAAPEVPTPSASVDPTSSDHKRLPPLGGPRP
jgi:hypothetical protein